MMHLMIFVLMLAFTMMHLMMLCTDAAADNVNVGIADASAYDTD